MHVPMCGPHKHTQTNVQYGAFEEWSLTEPQHQPVKNNAIPGEKKRKKKSEYTLEDFAKGGERHSYNIQGTAQLLRPKNNLVKHLISSNW